MKRFIQITFIAVIFTFLGVQETVAQKVGHVNAQSIVYSLPEMKQATSNLEALAEQYKKQLQASKEKLEAKLVDATNKEKRGELSPTDIQRTGASEEAANDADNAPLYEKIKKAINDVASENGYAYILDAAAILYAEEANDITGRVKAKLGM